MTGVEIPTVLGAEETNRRAEDLKQWIAEGQTFQGAFLPVGWKKVSKFVNENRQANVTVAEAAVKKRFRRFGHVEDLSVPQEELRPGARGALWDWTTGVCVQTQLTSIVDEVGYKVENVLSAAKECGFRDERAIQILTHTGSTHGTERFPLTCYAARNHQGAAARHGDMTKMVIGKVKAEHLVVWEGGTPFTKFPQRIPFGVVPVNGNVQYPGQVYEKVRGVWDGSSPHDDSSPNDFCTLYPEENPPWVSIHGVVQSMCVLLSIGVPVEYWKLDCKAAYCQLLHQVTQRWRQFAYWKWVDDDGKSQGGFFNDNRMMWGMRLSGGCFFRTISSLTVRWISYLLITR